MKKIIIDVVMVLAFVLLSNLAFTGLHWHQIIGWAVCGVVGVHLILNRQYIKGCAKKLRQGIVPKKQGMPLAINITLIGLILLIATTGILMSYSTIWILSPLHKIASYVLYGLGAIHLALHVPGWARRLRQLDLKKLEVGKKLRLAGAWLGLVLMAVMVGKTVVNALLMPDVTAMENPVATGTSVNKVIANLNKKPEIEGSPSAVTASNTGGTTTVTDGSSKKEDESVTTTTSTEKVVEAVPTLDDFLSKQFCTACSKHCPLTALKCSRGETYKAQAIEQYNQTYKTQL